MPSVNTRQRAATATAARYMWWAATVLSNCVCGDVCVCLHHCKSLHANLFPMNKIIIPTGMHVEVQNKGWVLCRDGYKI